LREEEAFEAANFMSLSEIEENHQKIEIDDIEGVICEQDQNNRIISDWLRSNGLEIFHMDKKIIFSNVQLSEII
jgi:hypothetical protein